MPTHEAIQSPTHPGPVAEKPIPTQRVTTKSPVKVPVETHQDQPDIHKTESQAAESVESSAESVKLSPQLSAFARKEQAFRQREQAWQAEKKAYEAKLADADQYTQLKAKLSSKDFSEAEKLGLTYEDYTQYLLSRQSGEDPQAQALNEIRQEIQALKKAKEESATREYDETVAEYAREISTVVKNSQDAPRVKKLGAEAEEAILRNILDAWEKDGLELTVEESKKQVEEYLTEVAQRLLVEEPKKEAEPSRPNPLPRLGTKTLNQNMAAVGTTSQPFKSLQALSEAERYAEARRRVLERQKGN